MSPEVTALLVVAGAIVVTALVIRFADRHLDRQQTARDLVRHFDYQITDLEQRLKSAKAGEDRALQEVARLTDSLEDIQIGGVCKVYGTPVALARVTQEHGGSLSAEFIDKRTYDYERTIR